jgi:ribosome biogenesis SPOUT family RNA methylase Rps3
MFVTDRFGSLAGHQPGSRTCQYATLAVIAAEHRKQGERSVSTAAAITITITILSLA